MRVLSLITLLFAAQFSFAAGTSTKYAYYGEELYNNISSGMRDAQLRDNILFVLESFHKIVPNQFDEISRSCSGSGCYTQVSLGYDGARMFLLGKYYLVDHGNGQYGVRDVYCDNEKLPRDFRKDPPAPNTIPSANVINTEHTWPQSHFGTYARGFQKADLHHLFPTDSQANSTRGSFDFGDVGQDTQTVNCPASRFGRATDGTPNVFEPPKNHKGNVARALFYFAVRYKMHIPTSEEAYLRKWSQEDPVDEDEVNRNQAIFELQGNRNPFIDIPGLEDSISDF